MKTLFQCYSKGPTDWIVAEESCLFEQIGCKFILIWTIAGIEWGEGVGVGEDEAVGAVGVEGAEGAAVGLGHLATVTSGRRSYTARYNGHKVAHTPFSIWSVLSLTNTLLEQFATVTSSGWQISGTTSTLWWTLDEPKQWCCTTASRGKYIKSSGTSSDT